VNAPAAAGPDPASLRRVLVPAEHGGWAFLGEPILLGLLVAWSPAGLLVAVATVAAFLARQPLKVLLGDRRRGHRYPRTAAAERAFVACAVVALAALAGATLLGRGPLLVAVGLGAPLGAAALAFDLARRSREAAAEVTAALALGAAASVIALAGGWPPGAALGLWGILAARSGPSVLYVRARLRLDRGEPAAVGAALWASLAGVALAAFLATAGLAPRAAVAAIVLLGLRALHGLSPLRGRLTTARLGLTEVLFGIVVVAATAVM